MRHTPQGIHLPASRTWQAKVAGVFIRIDDGKEFLADISTISYCSTYRRSNPDTGNGDAYAQANTVIIK